MGSSCSSNSVSEKTSASNQSQPQFKKNRQRGDWGISWAEIVHSIQEYDLIEIDRGGSLIGYHWALYDGSGYVLHVVVDTENDCKARLQYETLGNGIGNKRCRINNLTKEAKCNGLQEVSSADIGKRVQDLIRKVQSGNSVVKYNLKTQNCEHYVTEWRYGVGFCNQLNQWIERIGPELTYLGCAVFQTCSYREGDTTAINEGDATYIVIEEGEKSGLENYAPVMINEGNEDEMDPIEITTGNLGKLSPVIIPSNFHPFENLTFEVTI